MYHTAVWSRVVTESAGYRSAAFVARRDARICGILPAAEVRSRLTGMRLVSLPFSDECYALADDATSARALTESAFAYRASRRLARYEIRGPAFLRDGTRIAPEASAGVSFAVDSHFSNFVIPLVDDPDAVRATFARKAVRQTINKALRLGVRVWESDDSRDTGVFYRLYALNRKRHGIPPQPRSFFARIRAELTDTPRARLYVADVASHPVAALITIEYRGVTCAKYEGVDTSMRKVLPIYPLMWQAIESACLAGHTRYDFGRTAHDNEGLCEFKSRWGTERIAMPYYRFPPSEGISTVRANSVKYRVFTGLFRRMPLGLFCAAGSRLFRHFG